MAGVLPRFLSLIYLYKKEEAATVAIAPPSECPVKETPLALFNT